MANTTFVDGETLIEASWLQDVNDFVYAGGGGGGTILASNITVVPTGTISSTDVQAAIVELNNEKQPMDGTLTGLASWTNGTNKVPYTTSIDTFSSLDFKDEDNMSSNSATALASQQSIKAYADTKNIATQVAPSTAGNVLTSDGAGNWVSQANINGIVYSSPINTTSGSSVEFTDIPAGTKRITILFNRVEASFHLNIVLGTASGYETTGYIWSSYTGTTGFVYRTVDFQIPLGTPTSPWGPICGTFTLTNCGGNTWNGNANSVVVKSSLFDPQTGFGNKSLADEITKVKITVDGTGVYSAGSIILAYEG